MTASPVISPRELHVPFSRKDWASLRENTQLALEAEEIARLRSLGDHIDVDEVESIYLPISRLLSAHVDAMKSLYDVRRDFLRFEGEKAPFIIGIAGSVAVGKSTTARVLQELLRRWPSSPKVALVTTDGFLFPNAELDRLGLMTRKGFPESYDRKEMIRFLSEVKSGRSRVSAPVYSHLHYDIMPDELVTIERPDILIFEGLNVLQVPEDRPESPIVSDFFDFSIYVDAEPEHIRKWYVTRFMTLRKTAFTDPNSFFHRYASFSDAQALEKAESLWRDINHLNLVENIQPCRPRARLILKKGPDHLVERIGLRRL